MIQSQNSSFVDPDQDESLFQEFNAKLDTRNSSYLKDPWNLLDFIIIMLSVLGLAASTDL